MHRNLLIGVAIMTLTACAGRSPQPVATANNVKVQELADEQGWKTTQNVAAGVAGLFIPVLWFGMDFQGAASKEVTALQARQQYLATLAGQRCARASR
jgi:hypothetical protein